MAEKKKSILLSVGGRKVFGFVLSLTALVALACFTDRLSEAETETLMYGIVFCFTALTVPNAIEHLAGAIRRRPSLPAAGGEDGNATDE